MKGHVNFPKCLEMMRQRDPQTQEDGFSMLLRHSAEYVPELIRAFGTETDHGLRCWILELIGSAKSSVAFRFLAEQLRSDDERFRFWAIRGLERLNTKEARTLLYHATKDRLSIRRKSDATDPANH
jgi:hypothetical protein